MKRVTYVLSDPLLKKLQELSKKLDLTMSDVVRRALEDYIQKNENT